MTKPISKMSNDELIWKAEGAAMSAKRVAQKGGDPVKQIGHVVSALKLYRERTGI
jgi:hypothetical protein